MAFVRRQQSFGFLSVESHDNVDQPPTFVFGEDPTLPSEEEEEEQSQKVQHHWLVESPGFKVAVSALVATNTVVMGIEVDHPELEHVWDTFEHFFTAGFLAEMLVKLYVLGRHYFSTTSNRIDAFLVAAAILDIWIFNPIGITSNMQTLTLLRWFRFLRLIRLAKVVTESRKLLLICESMMDTIKVAIYVGLLLFLTIYACAIFCVQMVGRHSNYPGYAEDIQEINEQEIMANFNPHLCFGSLGAAMLTLFNIATITEWSEIVRPISVVQPPMTIFFLLFMLTIGFGLMNVIVGMIVDNMLEQSEKLKRQAEHENRLERKRLVKRLHSFFESVDDDHNHNLTAAEMEPLLSNPDIQQLLRQARLPAGCTCQEFMTLLDQSGDGSLTHTEFILSLYRLLDDDPLQHLSSLQAGVNHIKLLVRQTASSIHHRLDALEKRLDSNAASPKRKPRAQRKKIVGEDEQTEVPANDGPGSGANSGSSSTHLPSYAADDTLGHDHTATLAQLAAWNAVLRKMTDTNLMTQSIRNWRFATDMCKHQAFASRVHEDMQSSVVAVAQRLASQRLHVAKALGKQAITMQGNQMALVCWHAWTSARAASPQNRFLVSADHEETRKQLDSTKQTYKQKVQPEEFFASASAPTLVDPPATQYLLARAPQAQFAEHGGTLDCAIGTPLESDEPVSPASPARALPSSSLAALQGSTGDSPAALQGSSGDSLAALQGSTGDSPAALQGSTADRPSPVSSKESSCSRAANETSCASEPGGKGCNVSEPSEFGLEIEAGEEAEDVTTRQPEAGDAVQQAQRSVAGMADLDNVVLELRGLPPVPAPLDRPVLLPPHRLALAVDADASCGKIIDIGLQAEARELAKRFARAVDADTLCVSATRHEVGAHAMEADAQEFGKRVDRTVDAPAGRGNTTRIDLHLDAKAAPVSLCSGTLGRGCKEEPPE